MLYSKKPDIITILEYNDYNIKMEVYSMGTKEEVIKLIKELPNHVTDDEIIQELYIKAEIEKGLHELNLEEYYSHDKVKEKLGKWLN